jgi:hypothetical protein
MAKITSNASGLALAISFGILLVSAATTSSLLGAPPSTGKPNSNSTMKSSNVTQSASKANKTGADNVTQSASKANKTGADNVTKTSLSGQGTPSAPYAATSNNTTGNITKAGNSTEGNITKAAGGALSNVGKAVGGGLKGLGNLISGNKK